jgi:tRNA(fMet)-specific endonuclease VapC
MILLDANILIFCIRGREPVTSRVKAADPNDVAIPSIVAFEIEYGSLKSSSPRRKSILSGLLNHLQEIPFDRDAARNAARIRVDLEKRGNTIGMLDLMIAGTAMSRGATLITNNVREFSRVKGLRIADWTL